VTSDIIIQVELSEFRQKVFHALPTFPNTITLADLTRKVYKTYDAKRDKGRRSHVQKALYDLWKLKIAGHEAKRLGGTWTRPKYYRTRARVVITTKNR